MAALVPLFLVQISKISKKENSSKRERVCSSEHDFQVKGTKEMKGHGLNFQ